jgi:hypothetical protein
MYNAKTYDSFLQICSEFSFFKPVVSWMHCYGANLLPRFDFDLYLASFVLVKVWLE